MVVFDEENQKFGIPASQMEVHDALVFQQRVPDPVDPRSVIVLQHASAVFDTANQGEKLSRESRRFQSPSEVAPPLLENRLGLFFDAE
jgi:hypothetical protein